MSSVHLNFVPKQSFKAGQGLAHGGVLYGMELGSVTLKINNQHTPGEVVIWATPVSGTGTTSGTWTTGGGSGYAAF